MREWTKPRVLVVGGYGVFGGRLARRLSQHDDVDVFVAGRRLAAAEAHCDVHGGTPIEIDTTKDPAGVLNNVRPAVVIDAAGPFQSYGEEPYRMAQAAIAAGAHYLDLADDGGFVSGVTELDEAAKRSGVAVLSGCSSVPAISAAAVSTLARGLTAVDSIESVILPGNRAPRGFSVMAAILAQVGRPIRVLQGGKWRGVAGWCDAVHVRPAIEGRGTLGSRLASPIGVPDLQLFPEHYGARTVRFRAGLEVGLMHRGLMAFAWLVRAGVLRSAVPLAGVLLWLANLMKPLGSDRGAMMVDVIGRRAGGEAVRRRWTLIAEGGDGPEIPSTPAYLLALRLCRKTVPVRAGARPATDDLTLDDIEAGLGGFAIATAVTEEPVMPLFEDALGDEWGRLPPALQELHDVLDTRVFTGRAVVERGASLLAGLIGWCMGFPHASDDVAVNVEMIRSRKGERWSRSFGASRFVSHLSRRPDGVPGEIIERFGLLSFTIGLHRNGGELEYPVVAGRLLDLVSLPTWLLPVSETREYVDEAGRACFDVRISMRGVGLIVRYKGWLNAANEMTADVQSEVKSAD